MVASPVSKSMFNICLFLVLTLFPLFNPQHAYAGRTVKAGIYNFKPMVYSDTGGSAQGFFVKILNHIAQKENWNVQYVPGTWQEGMDRLNSNQIDLLLCIGYTKERDKYLDFPKEFLHLDWGTIYKAKGSSINNIFDLEGKTVSILKGSLLSAGFQELIEQFQIHVTIKEMDQASEVLASVVSGSADAGVAANLSGILNEAFQKVDRTPIIFTPVKLGFAVNSGKNADLVKSIDRWINALKADKTSIYFQELENFLGKKEVVIPKEVYWALFGVVALFLLIIGWSVILKRQVRAKTESLEVEIADRKLAEEMLSKEKAFLRSVIDSANDLIYLKDQNSTYIGCNKASEKFTGIAECEQLGKTDFDFFDPEFAELIVKDDQKVIESQTVVRKEEWVTSPVFGKVLLETMKAPIRGADGQLFGLVGISRDITVRKKAEDENKRLTDRLLLATSSAGLGIWDWNVRENTMVWDDRMFELCGITREETPNNIEAWTNGLHPEDKEAALAAFHAALNGEKNYDTEFRILTPDGTVKHLKANGLVIMGTDGKPSRMLGINADITDIKISERERDDLIVQLQDKTAEQERFIYTVSHDLKSPLVNISGFADLAEQDLNSGDQISAKNDLAIVKQSALRMKRLLDELLEISRVGIKKNPEEVVNLNALIDEGIFNLSGQINEFQTTIEVEPDLPDVRLDKQRFVQVIENLAVNASRYSKSAAGGSHVKIGVIRNTEELICYVKDNGIGIEPQYLEKVFGLFERVDTNSDGTGVGLAIVKRIIENHGGRIWAESEGLGHGTTFFFTVPEA